MFSSNDTFVEQVVKTKPAFKDNILRYVFLALTIVFLLLSMVVFIFSAGFILFAILTYVFWENRYEFEYDYTNGSLTIAKITNNSKRKVLAEVDSAEVRMIAAVGTNESLKYDHVDLKVIDCSAHDEEIRNYILVAHDEKKNSDYKIIFSPNDKLINAMKHYNKRDIYE